MSNQNQQPKPAKEQMKIVMRKIGKSQQAQREAKENNVSAMEDIVDDKIQNDKSTFDNEQMLLHFHDISEAIKLKHSKELFSTEEDLIITFKNQLISIEPSVVNSALAYEKLNKTYRLEAKAFIEVILSRFGDGYSRVTEELIVDFLNEIIKEKKLQIEKEDFKRKIVWIKK